MPTHGANFDLVLGRWGEGTGPADRATASLEYRLLESGPTFRVIDAAPRASKLESLAARSLSRADVIGTPLAEQVFAMTDLILADDARLSELLGDWTIEAA